MVGGGPQKHLVQHFVHNVFQRPSRNDFFSIFCRFGLQGSQGRTHEGPTNNFLGYFSHPASVGDPWGAQGCQSTPQDHQNDSKIDSIMTPEGTKTSPKDPYMNPLAQGINGSIGPSTNSASPANAASRPIMPDIPNRSIHQFCQSCQCSQSAHHARHSKHTYTNQARWREGPRQVDNVQDMDQQITACTSRSLNQQLCISLSLSLCISLSLSLSFYTLLLPLSLSLSLTICLSLSLNALSASAKEAG